MNRIPEETMSNEMNPKACFFIVSYKVSILQCRHLYIEVDHYSEPYQGLFDYFSESLEKTTLNIYIGIENCCVSGRLRKLFENCCKNEA